MAGGMELVLIRHTRCDVTPGACYGHLDVPLAHTASADIEQTLARTPSVARVFSSPSRRCHLLAEALARRDGCPIHVLPELQELNFGEWEGVAWSVVPRALSDAWAEDPWNRAPPRGESERELWERVKRATVLVLESFAQQSPNTSAASSIARTPSADSGAQRIAIVSHGGPLRHLRCLLTRTPAELRWSRSIEFGEVVRVECDPQTLLTDPPE
jgi:broad specificity phosphatase PhoE